MAIKKLNQMQLDQLLIKLYTEFQDANKNLYRKDLQSYFHKQFDYVQKRIYDIIYFDNH